MLFVDSDHEAELHLILVQHLRIINADPSLHLPTSSPRTTFES
jgi:hypothetical protein